MTSSIVPGHKKILSWAEVAELSVFPVRTLWKQRVSRGKGRILRSTRSDNNVGLGEGNPGETAIASTSLRSLTTSTSDLTNSFSRHCAKSSKDLIEYHPRTLPISTPQQKQNHPSRTTTHTAMLTFARPNEITNYDDSILLLFVAFLLLGSTMLVLLSTRSEKEEEVKKLDRSRSNSDGDDPVPRALSITSVGTSITIQDYLSLADSSDSSDAPSWSSSGTLLQRRSSSRLSWLTDCEEEEGELLPEDIVSSLGSEEQESSSSSTSSSTASKSGDLLFVKGKESTEQDDNGMDSEPCREHILHLSTHLQLKSNILETSNSKKIIPATQTDVPSHYSRALVIRDKPDQPLQATFDLRLPRSLPPASSDSLRGNLLFHFSSDWIESGTSQALTLRRPPPAPKQQPTTIPRLPIPFLLLEKPDAPLSSSASINGFSHVPALIACRNRKVDVPRAMSPSAFAKTASTTKTHLPVPPPLLSSTVSAGMPQALVPHHSTALIQPLSTASYQTLSFLLDNEVVNGPLWPKHSTFAYELFGNKLANESSGLAAVSCAALPQHGSFQNALVPFHSERSLVNRGDTEQFLAPPTRETPCHELPIFDLVRHDGRRRSSATSLSGTGSALEPARSSGRRRSSVRRLLLSHHSDSSISTDVELLEYYSSTRRRSSGRSLQPYGRRRSSLLCQPDDWSVSTMDTDVELDMGLALMDRSYRQDLACLEEYYLDDDDSSYETADGDASEISFSDMRRGSRSAGGTILADVLALPSSTGANANSGHLLTLPSSTNPLRNKALPASNSSLGAANRQCLCLEHRDAEERRLVPRATGSLVAKDDAAPRSGSPEGNVALVPSASRGLVAMNDTVPRSCSAKGSTALVPSVSHWLVSSKQVVVLHQEQEPTTTQLSLVSRSSGALVARSANCCDRGVVGVSRMTRELVNQNEAESDCNELNDEVTTNTNWELQGSNSRAAETAIVPRMGRELVSESGSEDRAVSSAGETALARSIRRVDLVTRNEHGGGTLICLGEGIANTPHATTKTSIVKRASTSMVKREDGTNDAKKDLLDKIPSADSRTTRRRKKRELLLQHGFSKRKLLTFEYLNMDDENVEVGDCHVISNMDLVLREHQGSTKPSGGKYCTDEKQRRRLKNARLVLKVVLGSKRKDYKTSKACYEVVDHVVAFKRQMISAMQEVSKSQQTIRDLKALWSALLSRKESISYSMLPEDFQSWDHYDKSLHLLQKVQEFILPAVSIKMRSNSYPKIGDFSETGPDFPDIVVGFSDGRPVVLNINPLDSDPSRRIKYDKHLPLSLQDALRAVRSILPPKHKRISGTDCLQAIKMYAMFQIQWKRLDGQLQAERLFFQEVHCALNSLVSTLAIAFQNRSPNAIRSVAAQIQKISGLLGSDNN